jgi:Domain of unknown function (DUF1707)
MVGLTVALRFSCIVLMGEVPGMAGPGDEIAAGVGGRSRLRASHADREQVIGMLKAAFVQGRLAKDEFDQRVGQTFAARTYGELVAVTADLPPGLITAQPPRKPARARARPPVGKAVLVGTAMIIPPAMLIAALLTGNDPLGKVFLLIAPWYLIAWIAAGMQLIANWHDNRSRGQLPPRPKQGGQALEGKQDGKPGDDWTLCQARRDARARHLPGHGVIQRILWSLPGRRDQRRPANLQVTA